MTKEEIIDYMYENHVQGDFKIEEMAEDLSQKTGKWIDYSDEGYVECPFCHSATNCDGNKDELHYCFSCGADMRSEAREYLEYGKLIAKGIAQGLRGDSDEP